MGTRKKKIDKTKFTNTTIKAQSAVYLQSLSKKHEWYTATGVLGALVLLLFTPYIFGDSLFLFTGIGSDTVNSWWPEYTHFSHYLREEGLPTWSFEVGMGQNIFPAHLAAFPGILIYLVNPGKIPYALAYLHLVQIFLGGFFFYLFLRKSSISIYSSLVGGMLYACTGFMIVGSTWYSFATDAFYIALMLYAVELVRKDNNLLLFPMAVALLAVYPVQLFHACLLVAAYLAACYIRQGYPKSYFVLTGKLFLLGAVGVSMAALFMFGHLYQMLDSPRGTGLASYTDALVSKSPFHLESWLYYKTFLLRMLGNDMAGYANHYQGWYNYLEAPLQYCGLLSLLLVPQLVLLRDKKVKWLAGTTLLLALSGVLFPYLRHTFWLFTGDYFRTYSLFLTILQIILAVVLLDYIIRNRTVNFRVLLATALIICAVSLVIDISNKQLAVMVILSVIAEVALLWFITRKDADTMPQAILLGVVFLEMLVFSWGALNAREVVTKSELAQRIGYNDHTLEAVKYLKDHDKGFYRIHKNYASGTSGYPSINDAMIQGYYSSLSYHSFNQKNYVRFLQMMDLIERNNELESRWLGGLRLRPMLMQLASNKYLLRREANKYPTDEAAEAMTSVSYEPVAQVNDISIYRNKYFLPLGFTYNTIISESEMGGLGHFRDLTMLKAVVVNDAQLGDIKGLSRFNMADTVINLSLMAYDSITNLLKQDTLNITSFSQKRITGNISTASTKMLFFSIPYDRGWQVKVNGTQVRPLKVNYGFMGIMLDKGTYQVELAFVPRYFKAGTGLSIFGLLAFIGLCVWHFIKQKNK